MGKNGIKDSRISISGLLFLVGLTALIFIGSTGLSLAPETARIARISTPGYEPETIRNFTNEIEHLAIAQSEPSGNEKTYFLSLPAVVTNCSLDNSRPGSSNVAFLTSANLGPVCPATLTEAVSVSAEKAAEFTLLGAKPSGTS
jgi:hypothetical protein